MTNLEALDKLREAVDAAREQLDAERCVMLIAAFKEAEEKLNGAHDFPDDALLEGAQRQMLDRIHWVAGAIRKGQLVNLGMFGTALDGDTFKLKAIFANPNGFLAAGVLMLFETLMELFWQKHGGPPAGGVVQ